MKSFSTLNGGASIQEHWQVPLGVLLSPSATGPGVAEAAVVVAGALKLAKHGAAVDVAIDPLAGRLAPTASVLMMPEVWVTVAVEGREEEKGVGTKWGGNQEDAKLKQVKKEFVGVLAVVLQANALAGPNSPVENCYFEMLHSSKKDSKRALEEGCASSWFGWFAHAD
ncbi:hypothetical protein HDU82_006299 [Entophlyctis luteolus]|nr:hypothetical protein HDU82_006299 [Entophlyctis luteolus]